MCLRIGAFGLGGRGGAMGRLMRGAHHKFPAEKGSVAVRSISPGVGLLEDNGNPVRRPWRGSRYRGHGTGLGNQAL